MASGRVPITDRTVIKQAPLGGAVQQLEVQYTMNATNEQGRPSWPGVLPAVALAAVWLLALSPLIQPGLMTCSHDGVLHLSRAFHLDTLARQGIVWPRWSPGMVFGYGYPLFNFYPAVSLYPALALHRLGQSLLQSFNLSFALSMLASGLALYLWAREVVGAFGGFVAAAAFMLAPYQLYDAYWRGALAESLTWPLLPLGMWAALRVARETRWRYALIGALVYAVILLTHAPASLMFTLLLPTYALTLLWGARDRRTVALQLAGMLALGLGLTAFFLVPAFLERGQVQLWRAITLGEGNFRANFLTLTEIVGPAEASDPLLINPPPLARSLGWAAGALAVLGVLATVIGRARVGNAHKQHVAWAGLTMVGAIMMTLPVSEPVWSHVPLLPFIQLPWRFLEVASLLSALLVGAGVAVLSGDGGRAGATSGNVRPGIVSGVCLVVIAAGAAPWAYPRLCPVPENPDLAFAVAFEQETGFIGTTTLGEYLPVTVQEVPTTSPMVKPMLAGQPVVRWDAPGARVLQARDDGLSAELILESQAPLRVTYRAFYFPGWQALVDGRPVSLAVIPPLGLIGIDVPAGRHTLAIHFGSTRLRTAGGVVSVVAVLAVLALGMSDFRSALHSPPSTLHFQPSRAHPPRAVAWLALTALALSLAAVKVSIVDQADTLLRWRRLQGGQIKGAGHISDVVAAERARLPGYEVWPEQAAADDVLYVDLYWTLDKPLNFLTTVRLLDEHGLEWSSRATVGKSLLKGYNSPPSSQEWPVGAYVRDRHAIRLLPGTPPGDLLIVVVPFEPQRFDPLPTRGGQPTPGSYPGVVVGRVRVAPPKNLPEAGALDLAVRSDVMLGADMALVGYSQDRDQAAPGQDMLLMLGWQARRKPQADYFLRLELVGAEGKAAWQASFPPGGAAYPTTHWRDGEVVRSQTLVRIPGRAASGQYSVRLTLADSAGAPLGQADLGRVQVAAPERVFTAPAVQQQVEARLGNEVALVGFDAPAKVRAGQPAVVKLVWQAVGETEQEYKVFVHLIGAGGQLVAQSDAAPAGWTRPTSGWQVGEFVTDVHTLELGPETPPGEYRLVAGMYDASTGQRLPVASGGDVVELSRISVTKRE